MSRHDEQAHRYPLAWPVGWKRTPSGDRRRARFSQGSRVTSAGAGDYVRQVPLTVSQAVERLDRELRRLGASQEILSTNIVLRLDGVPRSNQPEPQDPGAAIYFKLKDKPRALACDRWTRVADNIAALAMHIEALRAIERYGVGTMEQAFAGYAALPPAAEHDWRLVLGVTAAATLEDVETAYRLKARATHPDTPGGDHAEMTRLNQARDAARKALTA